MARWAAIAVAVAIIPARTPATVASPTQFGLGSRPRLHQRSHGEVKSGRIASRHGQIRPLSGGGAEAAIQLVPACSE